MNINTAYYDRVRYTLQHPVHGPKKIAEPIGWRVDDKEFARNKRYHGIFSKFSNNLRFTGEARDYINIVRKIYGVNAEIRLIKDIKDFEEKWIRSYTGFLDMSTWGEENNQVEIKFNSAGLEKILKARRSDKIELERLTNLKGQPIDPLVTKKLQLDGRRIFLETTFDIKTASNQLKLEVKTNAGNTRNQTGGTPWSLFGQSHDLANSVIPETTASENVGTTGMMFYANNDRTRDLKIKIPFLNFEAFFQQYENVQWCFYKTSLVIYENGVNYDVKQRITLHELNSGFSGGDTDLPADFDFAYPQFTKIINTSLNEIDITLLKDESLALEIYLKSDMYFDNNAGVRVFAGNMEGKLIIEEDSGFPPNIINGLLAHELFDRQIEIITNSKGNFRSDILGRIELGYKEDGRAAYAMVSHGHWIRNFTSEDNLYKPFITSFKDSIDTFMADYNVGVGIERKGFKEQIVIEDLKHFYNLNVLIRLGEEDSNGVFKYSQVKKLRRYSAKDYYYSSVVVGSNKGGEYEEVMGLEETNASANFLTEIDAVVKEYKKEAPYRHDNYGEEIIRRKSIEVAPTTDQSGDQHIWMHDVKIGLGDVYNLKKWQDVLVAAPLGMFSPDTAYNFIYSPVSLLLEHGWVLNAGLQEYPKGSIIFGSSKGKSSISQHLIGGNLLAENKDFPVSHLEKARYKPEIIEFEFEVNDVLLSQIEGFTVILNKEILNIYGLIEFKNDKGILEKGFLLNLKPNKEGKWKLLKANR